MGPQLYRCGNGPNATKRQISRAELQWGRNFIVAEICPETRQPDGRVHGFNGAATLSLRKRAGCVGAAGAIEHASMGPQLYRCGNMVLRKTGSRSLATLQWGRNFIVAEIGLGPQLQAAAGAASMGPQLYRCGNVADVRGQLYLLELASMGPQLYRCGNTSKTSDESTDSSCFNGAATLSLRKRAVAAVKPRVAIDASMRPQLYRCGNYDAPKVRRVPDPASMRPQLYRCGNTRPSSTA